MFTLAVIVIAGVLLLFALAVLAPVLDRLFSGLIIAVGKLFGII